MGIGIDIESSFYCLLECYITTCRAIVKFKVHGLVAGIGQGQDLRWYRLDVIQTCVIVSVLRRLDTVNLIFSFLSWDEVISGLCDLVWICFEAAELVSRWTVLVCSGVRQVCVFALIGIVAGFAKRSPGL